MNLFSLKCCLMVGCTIFGLFYSSPVEAAGVSYQGKREAIAPSFARPMQCIIDAIQAAGYRPREVGCFGTRPGNRSAHPSGHACDIDQTSRNVTGLNRSFNRAAQNRIAERCNAVSGCKWRNPDCGHFEQRSAPYSRAGAPVGGRRYHYGRRR
jgi:hypothetical protein